MKKLITIVIVAICGLQVGFSQEIDEITLNKMRVQLFSAQEQDSLGNYYKVLERIDKLEVLANGQKTEKGQNLKVKAYVGLEMFEKARKELDILYSMGPSNAILKEISRYEIKIDDGIEEEKARKERARLAEIKRKEVEKKAAEERKKEWEKSKWIFENPEEAKKTYATRALKDTTYFNSKWQEVGKYHGKYKYYYYRLPIKKVNGLYKIVNYISTGRLIDIGGFSTDVAYFPKYQGKMIRDKHPNSREEFFYYDGKVFTWLSLFNLNIGDGEIKMKCYDEKGKKILDIYHGKIYSIRYSSSGIISSVKLFYHSLQRRYEFDSHGKLITEIFYKKNGKIYGSYNY